MTKGTETRQAILTHAAQVASRMGLEGLTIGRLASEMQLSKSGLFAHFQSKQALQLATLRHTAELFVEFVVRPALAAPRGEARVRALVERWLEWGRAGVLEGGCLFVAASSEYDDRDGPLRDELVRQQRDLLELIGTVAGTGASEGEFRSDLDTEQFAWELYGILLAYHSARRLFRDERADDRAGTAVEALIARARISH
jgi:AcrR family transcriptional regulator